MSTPLDLDEPMQSVQDHRLFSYGAHNEYFVRPSQLFSLLRGARGLAAIDKVRFDAIMAYCADRHLMPRARPIWQGFCHRTGEFLQAAQQHGSGGFKLDTIVAINLGLTLRSGRVFERYEFQTDTAIHILAVGCYLLGGRCQQCDTDLAPFDPDKFFDLRHSPLVSFPSALFVVCEDCHSVIRNINAIRRNNISPTLRFFPSPKEFAIAVEIGHSLQDYLVHWYIDPTLDLLKQEIRDAKRRRRNQRRGLADGEGPRLASEHGQGCGLDPQDLRSRTSGLSAR